MERDMDLIREILLRIRSSQDPDGITNPTIEGYTDAQISYHIWLLVDGGLVTAIDSSTPFGGVEEFFGLRLRMAGHDFLNASRDSAIWKKAKDTVINSGVSFTVQSLLVYLKAEALSIAQGLV